MVESNVVDLDQYRLGRSGPSRYDKKRLSVSEGAIGAAFAKVPSPPSRIAAARVKFTQSIVWPMMGNDKWGDCTVAAQGHTVQYGTTYAQKRPAVPADQDVVDTYLRLGNGQDNGLTLLDVLNPWQQTGLLGDKLAAFAEIPISPGISITTIRRQLRQSIWLAGSAYLAWALPAGMQRNPLDWVTVGSGAQWRAGSWGGHCVPAFLYIGTDLYVVTWGKLVKVGEAFQRAYCDEAYMPVSEDWVNAHGKTPGGRALATVVEYAQRIAA